MKPLPPFEVNLSRAKYRIKEAMRYILDHKDEMDFDDAQQLSWELNNALGWLDSVEGYYKATITKEDKQ